jgi:peptidoglycan hydrolase CwlO-like protein
VDNSSSKNKHTNIGGAEQPHVRNLQTGMDSQVKEKKGSMVPLLAAVVVIVVLGAGFGYYYLQASSQISSLNTQNAGLSSQLSTALDNIGKDNNQIAALTSNVTSLQNQVSNDKSQISSLQGTISSDNASLATLSSQNATNSALIATLRANMTSLQNSVGSLNSQVGSLNSQISSLNSQISTLQGQVNSYSGLLALSSQQVEVSSTTVSPQLGQLNKIGSTFNVQYAGYVIITISGTFTPADVVLAVGNNFSSSIQTHYGYNINVFQPGSTSDSLIFQVVPGQATAYIATNETGISPTVSVVYYS